MSQAPIMPFYTDAYLADTHHLSTEAHGAYLLLLLHIWRCNGVAPPDDDTLLARITRQPLRRWKHTTRPLLIGFFTLDGGRWVQKRLHREWHSVQSKIEQNKQKGIKGNWIKNVANPMKNNLSLSAVAIAQGTPSINHDPSTDKPVYKKEECISEPSLRGARVDERLRFAQSESQKGDEAIHGSPRDRVARDDAPSIPHTPALTALKPILNDVSYFVRGGKTVSLLLKPQLIEAAREVSQLLKPTAQSQASELVDTLFLYFPRSLEKADINALKNDLITRFAEWPYDLIHSATHALIAAHPYPTLPPMSAFASRIEPALHTRRKQAERIERLLAQLH